MSRKQCVMNLAKLLGQKESLLKTLESQDNTPTMKNHIDHLKVKGKTVFKDRVIVQKLVVEPTGEKLRATPSEIMNNLKQMTEQSASIRKLMHHEHIERHGKRFTVNGDVTVGHLVVNKLNVSRLNNVDMNPNLFLSRTKSQKFNVPLVGTILTAKKLDAAEINGVPTDGKYCIDGPRCDFKLMHFRSTSL